MGQDAQGMNCTEYHSRVDDKKPSSTIDAKCQHINRHAETAYSSNHCRGARVLEVWAGRVL